MVELVCLSFRDVSELMFARGWWSLTKQVRLWTVKFGAEYTRRLRALRDPCGDTWHLDEIFCKINGELVYLWRAVDQSGEVLDVLVEPGRSKRERSDSSAHCLKVCATVLELW